jgi:hypothetical protein
VASLAGLSVGKVRCWLEGQGAGWPLACPDRPLCACLVARGGTGFIFVERDDPDDEKRFSLAHELAHFLRDYWGPRRRAEALLGAGALEVLDGHRPARRGERLRGVLASVPLGHHTHLLARDREGEPSPEVAAAERDADRLAWELLAPAEVVLGHGRRPRRELAGLLRKDFGLPDGQAWRYAGVLAPEVPPVEGWIARLREATGR